MSLRTEQWVCQGQAGTIECTVDLPGDSPSGWALVLHPHPLHGGTRDNKVVTTVARTCAQQGLMTVRPNFRGVGASQGSFDRAVGETADMVQCVEQVFRDWPQAAAGPWVLAGFSFGTAVAAQLQAELADRGLPPPARLMLIGCAVERFRYRPLTVPADTLLIHGEHDEVVPLSEGMDFARAHQLPMTVVPDAGHFFHGKLLILRQVIRSSLVGLQAQTPDAAGS
jgi:alpha/beta superfamily hydrolase